MEHSPVQSSRTPSSRPSAGISKTRQSTTPLRMPRGVLLKVCLCASPPTCSVCTCSMLFMVLWLIRTQNTYLSHSRGRAQIHTANRGSAVVACIASRAQQRESTRVERCRHCQDQDSHSEVLSPGALLPAPAPRPACETRGALEQEPLPRLAPWWRRRSLIRIRWRQTLQISCRYESEVMSL